MRGFTEDEVAPVRALRPRAPLRGALHRVHAARRRPRLDAGLRADRRGDPRGDQRRVAARGRAARAARDGARLPLRRRQGEDRLHQPGLRAVLRATATASASPPTASCARACSRSTRPTCARRCATARATTSSSRSSATRCGARSSSTTSTTRASCSPSARCRGSAAEPHCSLVAVALLVAPAALRGHAPRRARSGSSTRSARQRLPGGDHREHGLVGRVRRSTSTSERKNPDAANHSPGANG